MSESDHQNFDLPFPQTEWETNSDIGCSKISKFEIETGRRNAVKISTVNDDPDGLASYDRAFLFSIIHDHPIEGSRAYQRVTPRQAWQIAKFLIRHTVRAKAYRVYGDIRGRMGFGSRPREP
jgi:hypothetical protein